MVKTPAAWLVTPLFLACGASGIIVPHPDVGGALPDTVSLRIGQTLRYGFADVTFTGVSEDSRCPSDVTCVWAGNAVAGVAVGPAVGKGPTYQLLLNTAQSPQSGAAWGLRVTLLELAPVPVSTRPPRQEDYVARLELRPAP